MTERAGSAAPPPGGSGPSPDATGAKPDTGGTGSGTGRTGPGPGRTGTEPGGFAASPSGGTAPGRGGAATGAGQQARDERPATRPRAGNGGADGRRSAARQHSQPQDDPAWHDYLAAAQRLDAVRRGAANLVAEQERARAAARDELAAVHARLVPQRARLRELGVPDDQLTPTPAEAAGAAQAVGRDPGTTLAALRQARLTADAADAAVVSPQGRFGPAAAGTGGAPPWVRNLLVYVPFALVVLVIQLALYLTSDDSLPFAAVVCGLAMPAAAFGMGWVVTGLVFPPGESGRPQRTPLVGAAVCFAPVVVMCVGAGLLALSR